MSSLVERIAQKQLINPPDFVRSNTMYEVMTGSIAYGVATDMSDIDVVGFCIPKKDMIFPHLRGEIMGFGKQLKRFGDWQEHHVKYGEREYDFTIYSIVQFFQLCMDNNPNMVDTLYVPAECVLHCTKIGTMVRDKRSIFLHKGAWHKFKGFAYGQLSDMEAKNPDPGSKRSKLREQFGFDVKFAYNVVRLMDEIEQILSTGELDLRRNREQLKAIRRGEIKPEEIRRIFTDKERDLEKLYHESPLPWGPRQDEIKQLLIDCLEEHYGDLSSAIVNPDAATAALRDIAAIIERNNRLVA